MTDCNHDEVNRYSDTSTGPEVEVWKCRICRTKFVPETRLKEELVMIDRQATYILELRNMSEKFFNDWQDLGAALIRKQNESQEKSCWHCSGTGRMRTGAKDGALVMCAQCRGTGKVRNG